jgi:hypothetical protein
MLADVQSLILRSPLLSLHYARHEKAMRSSARGRSSFVASIYTGAILRACRREPLDPRLRPTPRRRRTSRRHSRRARLRDSCATATVAVEATAVWAALPPAAGGTEPAAVTVSGTSVRCGGGGGGVGVLSAGAGALAAPSPAAAAGPEKTPRPAPAEDTEDEDERSLVTLISRKRGRKAR